jgi:hypothetical protein
MVRHKYGHTLYACKSNYFRCSCSQEFNTEQNYMIHKHKEIEKQEQDEQLSGEKK